MNTKKISIFIGALFYSAVLTAQMTISSSSIVVVKGQISANNSINNSSAETDFTNAQVFLTGTDQTLTNAQASPLTLQGLTIDGGGNKGAIGDWTVTRDLTFIQGIFSTSSGKLLYTGPTTLNGNTNSFVNSTLFQRGTGVRFFPIGVGNTYMPMSLNDVQDATNEVGVTGYTTGANLSLPLDISSIANNRYWEIVMNGGSLPASTASLYVPGSSVEGLQELVVVEADNATGATAINLGGGTIDKFVTSFSQVTKPVLTIGIAEKVDLLIHDLITPFNGDDVNDKLKIVNIEYVTQNKVTLLDRWGAVVKQWVDFRNDDDTFDFSRLSPGNYICVLEYHLTPDSPKEELTQMITILKGN
jgi:CHU_C Type IX secretion signal domain